MHLQLQPDVAARLLGDPVLEDQGLLSRFLISAPDTTQGTRLWRDVALEDERGAARFHARMDDLLLQPPPLKQDTRNELVPAALSLSAAARRRWTQFHDHVEKQLSPGRDLHPISGFAAKLPEHAARLAGVMALFDNQPSSIDETTISRAIELARHYAEAALRLHGGSRISADLSEAARLLKWLHTKWSEPLISVRAIVRLGPNTLRDSRSARKLIDILAQHRWLVPVADVAIVARERCREAWTIFRG
jgi:hypothetical protein